MPIDDTSINYLQISDDTIDKIGNKILNALNASLKTTLGTTLKDNVSSFNGKVYSDLDKPVFTKNIENKNSFIIHAALSMLQAIDFNTHKNVTANITNAVEHAEKLYTYLNKKGYFE